MNNNIKITVLGTGTSVGIPALGQLGWGKCDPSNPKNKRQRCAVLIQSKNTTILVDAGPDIKNQLIEHNIQKLDAVLITHSHSDHVSGLDELRPFYFYNRDKKKLNTFIKKLKLKNYKIIDNKKILSLHNIDLAINSTSIGFDSWILRNKKFYNLIYFTPLSNLNKVKGINSKNKKEFLRKNRYFINQDKLNYLKFLDQNSNCEFFDIIYNPRMTKFLKLAKINGHKILNGLRMNLDQAVKAFCIVNNKKFEKINILMQKNG